MPEPDKDFPPVNISWVSVGVADMAAARALWVEQFGLEIIDQRSGPDPELAGLWGMAPELITEQLLLATPGADTGRLHFVEFSDAQPPVRQGAAPTDLGPKNLDVNCTGMPLLVDSLTKAGYSFRSAIAEYEFDGIQVREVQMLGHDQVNVVLIEVLSRGFEVQFTDKNFAALTSFVVIVPDVQAEKTFYSDVFGMETILAHSLSGAAIEQAAGLPAGTTLDLHLLGDPANMFGRMELIEYVGVGGRNLFPQAVPPATGILQCGFVVDALDDFMARPATSNAGAQELSVASLIFATGRIAGMVSPSGYQVYVTESS
jgi:catechol 2,3-dioxygenase-like lactoylglutathione lyase family enzyme